MHFTAYYVYCRLIMMKLLTTSLFFDLFFKITTKNNFLINITLEFYHLFWKLNKYIMLLLVSYLIVLFFEDLLNICKKWPTIKLYLELVYKSYYLFIFIYTWELITFQYCTNYNSHVIELCMDQKKKKNNLVWPDLKWKF